MSKKVIFKTYDQGQLSLLPSSYDDLVPINHPARIVNTIIDHLNTSALEDSYKGGGTKENNLAVRLEAVFGNIKQKKNFKRFMLRGIDKVNVNVEIGLIAMAHNLKSIV
ncbi:transposase [Mariniflexile litorale]|uniref:Transposase n=1 Tax=Mariniflexile litorale TaxID=3045158 RepID=A0AAU7EEZ5_9FLAO|nr:transposase [Mariniflexile sp. KMM 9835]MDQ8213127.1 transposase [Mariniflexile sp. KMM 9835]